MKVERKTCYFCHRKRNKKKLKEISRRLVVLRVYNCIDKADCLNHRIK